VKHLSLVSLACAVICVVGCSGGDGEPRLPTVKVKGKLYVDDKPYGGCRLNFAPTDTQADKSKPQPRQATAKVADDGTFELTTYEPGDGVPAGKYNVVLAAHIADTTATKLPPAGTAPNPLDNSVPIIKPFSIEIQKPDDGKPLQLDLKLEGTGEFTKGTASMTPAGLGPMGQQPK
jgi:hypothetical protein